LEDNSAKKGGAIYNNESTKLDLLDQTTISNNSADKDAGIYNVKGSQLKIKDKSNLIQNMAEDKGGAIYKEGTMSLKGGSIAKNIPDDIYNP
jgi:predicted outer membrane repeat protein